MNSPQSDAMLCPLDRSVLVMSERQGIEIDYCPTCRGVWLDRGELDKIIERGAADSAPARPPVSDPRDNFGGSRERRDERDYRSDRHRKPKSFLSELFD